MINNLHILVAEDDDFQRRMVVNMLHTLGATSISESSNGQQALDIIRSAGSRPVDVAICDLQMPEMDGMEFLRHLGEAAQKVSIIITSSLDNRLLASVGRMTQTYGLKLLGVIEKPITLERLKEMLIKHDPAQSKWQQPADAKSFTLAEILQGVRAQQFEPFFQPKVDLKTGRLSGAEALARWIHPEHGAIGPYAFIPQLEQSGNIDELTFLMLQKSAAACRVFLEKGHPLTVAVNLSLLSLDKPGFAEMIIAVVVNAGIDPKYIVLEITESATMTDVAHVLENLARLVMNGFALSIDDYGTGYSSMQQLTRIAFSELKIDQSFVKNCHDNPAMYIVVQSSIDMARQLGIKSVAEGVETQQDWDALKTMGADTVQGFFIAKPMALTAFHDFMATYSPKPDTLSPAARQDRGGKSILVIEDDAFTRKLIVSVLHHLGFAKITDVDSAESAIDMFNSNAFDLIITDINLPGMNGLKLVQMIRAGRTLAKRETRIVILTTFSQSEILGAALALAVNGFLVKPITPAMIDDKLATAMSERLHLSSPLAYEAVRTDCNSFPKTDRTPTSHRGASILLTGHNGSEHSEDGSGHDIPLQRLRPGMILKQSIYLLDGTMLLSSGHVVTDSTINRLHDLKSLLKGNSIIVAEETSPH